MACAPERHPLGRSLSTVDVTVTYEMSSVLKAMAGHKADPVYIIEDRTRTFAAETTSGQVDVTDTSRAGMAVPIRAIRR